MTQQTQARGAYKRIEEALDERFDRFDQIAEATYHDADGLITSTGAAKSASSGRQGPWYQMRNGQRDTPVALCGRAAREQGRNVRCQDGEELPYRENPFAKKGKRKGRAKGKGPQAQGSLMLGDSGLMDSLKSLGKKALKAVKQTFNRIEKKRNQAASAVAFHQKRGDDAKAAKAKAGAAALDSASDLVYKELERRGQGEWAKSSATKITDKDIRPGKRRQRAQAVAEELDLDFDAVDIAGVSVMRAIFEELELEEGGCGDTDEEYGDEELDEGDDGEDDDEEDDEEDDDEDEDYTESYASGPESAIHEALLNMSKLSKDELRKRLADAEKKMASATDKKRKRGFSLYIGQIRKHLGEGSGDKEKVVIEYGVVKNTNPNAPGWLPAVYDSGKKFAGSFAREAYSEEDAMMLAKRQAKEAAKRYTGDWDVIVRQRTSKNTMEAREAAVPFKAKMGRTVPLGWEDLDEISHNKGISFGGATLNLDLLAADDYAKLGRAVEIMGRFVDVGAVKILMDDTAILNSNDSIVSGVNRVVSMFAGKLPFKYTLTIVLSESYDQEISSLMLSATKDQNRSKVVIQTNLFGYADDRDDERFVADLRKRGYTYTVKNVRGGYEITFK